MPRAKPKPPGIRRKGHRWEVQVTVQGEYRSRTFTLNTPIQTMLAWRELQKNTDPIIPKEGTLGRDAVRYLRTVKHKPDYENRRTYLNRWIHAFGKSRVRSTITSTEIATVMANWRKQGLGPVTVRHHRGTLLQLYTVLDGADAPNPVKATPRPADPPAVTRAPSLAAVMAVLLTLRPSKTRARLRLMLATGLPHKQLMALKPEDWNKAQHVLYVTARGKGRGAAGRYLPLSEEATEALSEFDQWEAWGKFSPSTMGWTVRRACESLKLPPFRPYDLRHLHAVLLYQATGDLATTARLLGHKGTKTAERYTLAAHADVDSIAQAKVSAKLRAARCPKNTTD